MTNQSDKARSRISEQSTVSLLEKKTRPEVLVKDTNKRSKKNRATQQLSNFKLSSFNAVAVSAFFLSKRGIYFLAFILFSLTLMYFFSSVHPSDIANIVLFHLYLPILLVFGGAIYTLGYTLLAHQRRAIFLSLFSSLVLLLHFQAVEFSLLVIAIPLVIFLVTEMIMSLVFRQ